MKKPDGSLYYENVGKKDASGQPIKRDKQAIADLQKATGKPVAFTPYN